MWFRIVGSLGLPAQIESEQRRRTREDPELYDAILSCEMRGVLYVWGIRDALETHLAVGANPEQIYFEVAFARLGDQNRCRRTEPRGADLIALLSVQENE